MTVSGEGGCSAAEPDGDRLTIKITAADTMCREVFMPASCVARVDGSQQLACTGFHALK